MLCPVDSFACLNAGYNKSFPLAIINSNELISFDVDIQRSGRINEPTDNRFSWYMRISLVHYNNEQKVINKIPFQTLTYLGENYAVELSYYLSKRIQFFKKFYPNMDWLTPWHLSFCNYQKNCNEVAFVSQKSKDFIKYQNRNYPFTTLKNEAKYSRGFDDYSSDIFYINSVRLFHSKAAKLLVLHMHTGHDVSIGFYNENSKDYSKPKEYTPNFPFRELKNSVYFEPMMHHGFGTDIFIFVD